MSEDFTWIDGERLVRFARGAVSEVPRLLAERGFERYALVTTERALAVTPELGEAADVIVRLGPGQVPELAAAARTELAGRPLVALGGGRPIDVAKAVAAVEGTTCAAVPTTLSGAEMTRIHRLPEGASQAALVRPALVVADPDLMASQPMPGLAASAMNALGHAIESLYVPGRNPVADAAALRAVRLIGDALDEREPLRDVLALGALLASYALGATGYAVHHVVCQTLVRMVGTPHAETNAVILPHTVRLMEQRVPSAMGRLAGALGPQDGEPGVAAVRVAALAAFAGPTTLSDLGVGEEMLDGVVDAALERPQLANTPSAPDRDELWAMLVGAL